MIIYYVFIVFIIYLSIIYYVPASIIIHSLCCTNEMREKHSGVAEKPKVHAGRPYMILHDSVCVCVCVPLGTHKLGSTGSASTMIKDHNPSIVDHLHQSLNVDLSTLVIFSHHLRALATMNTTNMQWLAINSPLDKHRLTKLQPFINQRYHKLTIIERLIGHQ